VNSLALAYMGTKKVAQPKGLLDIVGETASAPASSPYTLSVPAAGANSGAAAPPAPVAPTAPASAPQ
jgi:hypothetical protein